MQATHQSVRGGVYYIHTNYYSTLTVQACAIIKIGIACAPDSCAQLLSLIGNDMCLFGSTIHKHEALLVNNKLELKYAVRSWQRYPQICASLRLERRVAKGGWGYMKWVVFRSLAW